MPYKKGLILFCIYIIILVGMSKAQVYSEFENKKICHIPITLDIPDIDVPAFLWAIFDHDPIPGYRERVLEDYASWYPHASEVMTWYGFDKGKGKRIERLLNDWRLNNMKKQTNINHQCIRS
jgi:hypothetical protein